MKKWFTARRSFSPENELNKFERSQRRFFAPGKTITCFYCHEYGHVAVDCKNKKIQDYSTKHAPNKKVLSNKQTKENINN